MAAEPATQLLVETREGVPVHWTPESPHLSGVVMFRVGRSDETPTTAGLTHLVEHLALYGLGPRIRYEHNGRVDSIRTVFWAQGNADDVAGFVTRLCETLAGLPVERIEAECRVLRTEAAGRAMGMPEMFYWYRFGARGPGMGFLREFALDAPDPEAVRAWGCERFTAENATAWFSGPIPDAADFKTLPHGRRIPCPTPESIGDLRTPAVLCGHPGCVGISLVAERELWLSIPLQIAVQRLHERLRYREGLVYAVQHDYQPISALLGHSTLWANCLDEHAASLQQGLLEVLDDLAQHGPTIEELREVREEYARFFGLPDSLQASLDRMAMNDLLDRPGPTPAGLLQELEAKTPESCAAAVRAALESALLMLPPGCESKPGFNAYPVWSRETATGRRYRAATQRFPWSPKGPVLIVGDDGVSFVNPEGGTITVYYAGCAGAVVHPQGTLQLIGEDGFQVVINPAEWRNGAHAREAALRAVPRDRLLVIRER